MQNSSILLPADIADLTRAEAEATLARLLFGSDYRAEAAGTDDPRMQAWVERNIRHQFLSEPLEPSPDTINEDPAPHCRRFRLRLISGGVSRAELAMRARLSLASIHTYCRWRKPPAAVERVLTEMGAPDGAEIPCPTCLGRFPACKRCRGEGVIIGSEVLAIPTLVAILGGDTTLATPDIVTALIRAYLRDTHV